MIGIMDASGFKAQVQASRILIVDDSELSVQVIEAILKVSGYHNLHNASNGLIALEMAERKKPDMIILDMLMPDMDGFEFCERIKKDSLLAEVPILVLTALPNAEKRATIYQLGISDLLTKPINPEELLSKTAIILERSLLIKTLANYRQEMERDLESAHDMQHLLLPTEAMFHNLRAIKGIDIASAFIPSHHLGGDIWGIREIDENKTMIFATDFSGHGITAALDTFRFHTLVQEMDEGDLTSPSRCMEKLNQRLKTTTMPGHFATCFVGVLDKAGILEYAAAACPSPIIISPDSTYQILDGSGFPLGINANSAYDNRKVKLPTGSLLALYSDALTETPDSSSSMLNEPELAAMLAQHSHFLSCKEVTASFMASFQADRPTISDDLTLVLCRLA